MRNRAFVFAFAFGTMALAPVWGQERDLPPLKGEERPFDFRDVTDEQFAEKATLINLMEITLGNHAAVKARRADIQQFANQLRKEHTDANHQLEMIAVKRRLTLPKKLDAKHQSKVDKLIALPGDEFDRAYVRQMVDGHSMATVLYEHESQNGKVSELKAYAGQTLPTIRRHYQKALQLWNDYFVSIR